MPDTLQIRIPTSGKVAFAEVEKRAREHASAEGADGELRYLGKISGDDLHHAEGVVLYTFEAAKTTRPDPQTAPSAAYIEIVERGRTSDDTPGGSLVVPNEVRINGIPLLVTEDGVKIHEMTIGGPEHEAVLVTLTLFARRVTIAAEGGPLTGGAAQGRDVPTHG